MLGTLLGGRYKIIRLLGSGGFGQTYLATDTQHPAQRTCVVKQFKPSCQEDDKMMQVARRLFHTEAATLSRLGQHGQIPEMIAFFEEDQEFYLVQEFIDGQSLSEELSSDRRFTEEEAINLLKDVLDVLEFVHSQRVIHRDIKPGNLIRRQEDGKFVLIDFGAVKEIRTQLVSNTSGQTGFTVGIGTQGYTPSEQMAGRPNFSSDIYALGMTVIHALTGLSPAQLPVHPQTNDVIWQNRASVSLPLAFILDRMVRDHFRQRYQSATEVLEALQKMANLPADLTSISPSMLLPQSLQDQPNTYLEPNWTQSLKIGIGMAIVATMAMTGLVLGVRQLGWLEPMELGMYDRMIRLRPPEPPDPRVLVVEITESDLRSLNRDTPSDQTLNQALQNLLQHNPTVIGLDLHRDLPQEPGRDDLLATLQTADPIVAVMKLGETEEEQIPPPPGVPSDRIGFSDLILDADGVVRRSLLFATTESQISYSFAIRLALQYLAQEGIQPQNSSQHSDYMQLGDVVLVPLRSNSGGYQRIDAAGYQILLNYRGSQNVFHQVSLSDVLNNTVDPSWIENKIVLIGTTAISGKDLFETPYTASSQSSNATMAGVLIHAQAVSQIVSSVLDGDRLFWFLPEWLEIAWIIGWSLIGGGIAWLFRHPLLLGMGSITALVLLSGTTFVVFLNQGWLPVVTPAIALITADIAVLVYRTYRLQQNQQKLTHFFRNSAPSLDPLPYLEQDITIQDPKFSGDAETFAALEDGWDLEPESVELDHPVYDASTVTDDETRID